MKYSLGLWLALCLGGLQFVAVSFVVYTSYLTSERVLLDHAHGLLSDVGTNTAAHANSFLDPARGAAELTARLAENKVVSSDDKQLLEQLLFQQLQTAPQFAGVFYGDEQGDFVYVNRSTDFGPFRSKIISNSGGERTVDLVWRDREFVVTEAREDPEDFYDPRARPWYKTAKEQRQSIWTDPYIFFSSQRPGITIASPVISTDGSVRGVIGVDIEIDEISDFLAQLKVGENGSALIVNRNGDVIAHPQPDLLKAQNDDGSLRFVSIDEIGDPIAKSAFGQAFADGEISVETEKFADFVNDNEAYVSLIMPDISAELPWTIAVYAPERDFIGAIKANRSRDMWIAGLIAAITGLVGLVLANYIYRPVKAFAVRTALISQGEIDPAAPMPKTYSELDQINQSLTEQIRKRKDSEREYGLTFDMALRGMAQMDAKTGAFQKVNDKFAEMLGYAPEEILTLTPADLTHPDDPTLSWDIDEKNIDDHATNLEKRCIRKDGQPIWVKINAIIIRDNNGDPLHAVATVDDITETRVAERQIQKLNSDLSHLARGELLGQMAAGLAHELNQPLTAITQNVDAAMMTVSDHEVTDAALVQILNDLDQQAHRAGDIIKALRGFARKGEEWKSPFHLNELLQQSLRLVQAETTEHGVSIKLVSDPLPQALGIRVQIAQVIVNLLRNAIDSIAASDDRRREIIVTTKHIGDDIEVAVEDSGPGVNPDIDLFGQFETTKSTGMGLGLSICRSIVVAGGGKMWHDASFTTGARFCFTLQCLPAEDAKQEGAA